MMDKNCEKIVKSIRIYQKHNRSIVKERETEESKNLSQI